MLAVALVCYAPAWAQQKPSLDPERIVAAKELLEVTGAAKRFATVLIGMREPLRQIALKANPGNETEVSSALDLVFKRMLERSNEALELIVPLYAERFSVVELKEVNAFYKSPTGVKFVDAQPQIMQQSMAIGQA